MAPARIATEPSLTVGLRPRQHTNRTLPASPRLDRLRSPVLAFSPCYRANLTRFAFLLGLSIHLSFINDIHLPRQVTWSFQDRAQETRNSAGRRLQSPQARGRVNAPPDSRAMSH